MSPIEYECHHEQLLQDHSLKLTELEKEVQFKKEKIDQLQKSMEKIDKKLDKIIQRSEEKDSDIDKRVTSLESTVKVLKWITTLLFGSGVIWIIFNIVK
jgi:peptidoglycan hydrolase CwlO-like protein